MTIDMLVPLLASAILGYLIGSIPTGFLVVRATTGLDVRTVGSGRTGGTNVLRAAGRNAFALTVLGDLAKGAVSVLVARALFGELAQLVAGFCAVLGNNWSIFLRSRGGAGVMTTVGTLLVIAPFVVLTVGWLPILLVYVTRISSIGSLVAAIAGPLWMALLVYLGYQPLQNLIYVLLLGALLVVVHIPNIQRLLTGRERRIGEPVKKE
ncbi:MAG TPA: glycerol-3-phosphate 1-O-acyltransferase PlsY [Chloroflexota bacterium]|nr:glycerol-3-phosphate 1-O-acyltransferase PlsY [Chloroflexota bacterium]